MVTAMMTVSSPWKLGRNLSPRRISAWFRGLKRHSTLILHSATASVMITQYQRDYIRTAEDDEERAELELMASGERQKKMLVSACRSAGILLFRVICVCYLCVVLLESVAVMLGWRVFSSGLSVCCVRSDDGMARMLLLS